MKHLLTLFALLTTSLAFGQESCPNVYDYNDNNTIDIEDFLGILGLFADDDTDDDGIWDSQDDCIDLEACNYAASPTEPCAFIDVLGECGGGCEGDGDSDGICDDEDDCVGVLDECGVCNGPGPTEVVIEDIVTTYDSVYLPIDDAWFVYAVAVDTTFGYTCTSLPCGDPVSYQGYEYNTVLIGEQCWFAENLRYLPSLGPPADNVESPNAMVCGYGGNDINEAMSQESYMNFGALYNYPAVASLQLCPSGYHVPSDGEWQILEFYLGMPLDEINSTDDSRGISVGAHLALKSDSPLWSVPGNNSTGFEALPGGVGYSTGLCLFSDFAVFGSSSLDDSGETWVRALTDYDGVGISRFGFNPTSYFSVRCLQDSE